MAATEKIADSNRVLCIVYIVIIFVITVTAIGGAILVRRLEYIGGTRNDVNFNFHSFKLFVVLFFFVIPLLAGGAALFVLISLVLWHRAVGQVLFGLALLLIVPIICFYAFEYTVPLSPVFLEGFEQWVRQEADVDAIQRWLVNEGAKHAGQHYIAENGFPEELPKCLVELNPEVISFVDFDSQNGPNVEIYWFYWREDYGLIIEFPEMETPQEGRIEPYISGDKLRRSIKPGVYVFFRG